MQTPVRRILSFIILSLLTGSAWASSSNQGRTTLDRDATYEQDLRWEASADKTITPTKVLRWVMSLRGQTVSVPSQTEFQPIVNAHDGHVRFLAVIAFKF